MLKRYLKGGLILLMAVVLLQACSESVEQTDKAEPASGMPKKVAVEECVITPPAEPVACTMQYDPVCGCDGKTYGNACSARGAGVPHFKPGACEENTRD